MDWDTRLKTSKMDAFEERIRKCARDMEKVRSDYLKECSEFYEKNFNRFMTKEKRSKLNQDKFKLNRQINMHDYVFRHVCMSHTENSVVKLTFAHLFWS